MEYFFYCRDNPGTAALRERLTEAHWSFMDAYAEGMIARGPTLSEDGTAATGSLHIVDLPDAEAARVFAFEEPNYRAGVYGEVMVRRWRDLLGRTMWDFAGDPSDGSRFLVIGHGEAGRAEPRFVADADRDRLIVGGSLLSEDGADWLGTALAVQAPSRAEAEATLAPADAYERVEVHPWRFGGRR